MKQLTNCGFEGCPDAPAPGSHWCARHRRMFRQIGGVEPDPLHQLIKAQTDAHYVLSIEEIAARLGCAAEDVREHLWVLCCAGRALPWLPGPMQTSGIQA